MPIYIKRSIATVLILVGILLCLWAIDDLVYVVGGLLDFLRFAQEGFPSIRVWPIQGMHPNYPQVVVRFITAGLKIVLTIAVFCLSSYLAGSEPRNYDDSDEGNPAIDSLGYAIGAHVCLWSGVAFLGLAFMIVPVERVQELARGPGAFSYDVFRGLVVTASTLVEIFIAAMCLWVALAVFNLRRRILTVTSSQGLRTPNSLTTTADLSPKMSRIAGVVSAVSGWIFIVDGLGWIYQIISQLATNGNPYGQDAVPLSLTEVIQRIASNQSLLLDYVVCFLQFKLGYDLIRLWSSVLSVPSIQNPPEKLAVANRYRAGAGVTTIAAVACLAAGAASLSSLNMWSRELRGIPAAGVPWIAGIFVNQGTRTVLGFCLAFAFFKLGALLRNVADKASLSTVHIPT